MLCVQLYFYSEITQMIDLVRLNDNSLWSWDCWEGFNSEAFTFWIPVPLLLIHYRMNWLPRLTDINPTSELTPNYLKNIWQPTECKTHWYFTLLQEKEMGPLNWLLCLSTALLHLRKFLFPSPQSKHCFCSNRVAAVFSNAVQYFMPSSAIHPPIKASLSPPVLETQFR